MGFFLSSLVFTAQFIMDMIFLLCYTKLIKDKKRRLVCVSIVLFNLVVSFQSRFMPTWLLIDCLID